ncbi:MAG: cold-shock protein [Alphaproteobacteria bacterium]|nr:MAG: cold-shock protein [Alphaproteobacteria bacterium]
MTHFGTIKSYDSSVGTGRITPEKGGDALGFRKSDLKEGSDAPKPDQRFGYEVKDAENGKRYAINLQAQAAEAAGAAAPAANQAV